jgi:beta-glucosidase
MGGGSYNFEKIPELVKAGKLSSDIVDTAVSRLLRAKFALGIFENPYAGITSNQTTSSLIRTPENIALARQLDAESIVLLENHKETLPLSETANVAVIGPMAHGFMNVS